MNKKASLLKRSLFLLLGIGLLLLIWTIIVNHYQNDLLFPSIFKIIKTVFKQLTSSHTYLLIFKTFIRIIISLLIGFLIATAILVIYLVNPHSINIFKPLLTFMKSTPVIIISLFIWLILGANVGPYLINLLIIVPIILEALVLGVDNIEADINEYLKLEPSGIFQIIFQIKIPMIKNYFLMGLLQTFGLSFKVMIMAEYICQTKDSIGKELVLIKNNLEMAQLLGWALIIVIIVLIIEAILKYLKAKIATY